MSIYDGVFDYKNRNSMPYRQFLIEKTVIN